MDARGVENLSARTAAETGKPVILLVGTEPRAADVLSESGGLVVSYRTVQDARQGSPAGTVKVAVLGSDRSLEGLAGMLRWIRQRWPRCCSVVVGEAGDTKREVTARSGGALYFTTPVDPAEWNMLSQHAAHRGSETRRMG